MSISLRSSHIFIDSEVVKTIFENIHYAYVEYIEKRKILMITPVSSQWFIKMYENPTQFLLKDRNLKGDKTLAIREILLDNDLNTTDRILQFEIIEKTKLIKVKLE